MTESMTRVLSHITPHTVQSFMLFYPHFNDRHVGDHTSLNSLFHSDMVNARREELLDEMTIFCTTSSDRLVCVLNRICPSQLCQAFAWLASEALQIFTFSDKRPTSSTLSHCPILSALATYLPT